MIRFLLLTAVFGGLSYLMWRERMPDPALGFFVGASISFLAAFLLSGSARRQLRAPRRHPSTALDKPVRLRMGRGRR